MSQPLKLSSRAKWSALIVLALVGSLLVVVAAEGLIRLRQASKYGITRFEDLYRENAELGLRVLVPNSHMGHISINSLGFRGPEISPIKPKGNIRIAFMGASTTFCGEVSDDTMVWPNLVTEGLRKRFPGTNFDFVNAAVPGFRTKSSLKSFKYQVDKLDPDIVVIYEATNDLSYEVNLLAEQEGLVSTDSDNQPGWLSQHLLLWELAEKNIRVKLAQHGAESNHGRLVFDAQQLGNSFHDDLDALVQEAGKKQRRVAVATFSTRLRPEQSEEERKQAAVSALVYMPFMSLDGLLSGYKRYNDIIRDVANSNHSLLIEGENDIPGDAAHFVDSVHFSDAGSKMMADRVINALAGDADVVALINQQKEI